MSPEPAFASKDFLFLPLPLTTDGFALLGADGTEGAVLFTGFFACLALIAIMTSIAYHSVKTAYGSFL